MESNLKYKKAFLIIAYGVLVQIFILTLYELPLQSESIYFKYFIAYKVLIAICFATFAVCVHNLKLIKYWVLIFNIICFAFVLLGQLFSPGYQIAVIQFMMIYAIVFEGFPVMPSLLTVLFIIEYLLRPYYRTTFPDHPFFNSSVINALISSLMVSVLLERYVKRVKSKQSFLDRKLRYKGIKTDLFLHELKNKLQPLVSLYPHSSDLKEIVNTIRSFNSFNDAEEMKFCDIVLATKEKFKILGECTILGTDDFFIDQMDLQTILSNLMLNSQKICQERKISLHMCLENTHSGFSYEDNAGGMTDEQFRFFSQKEFKPYIGHEKNGIGLLLVKKLIEHHEGKFIIKKIPNGMKFEIIY
jgi:hypothetical protein